MKESGTKAGTAIQVYSGNKTAAQKWLLVSGRLVSNCAQTMVLDAVGGGKVADTGACSDL